VVPKVGVHPELVEGSNPHDRYGQRFLSFLSSVLPVFVGVRLHLEFPYAALKVVPQTPSLFAGVAVKSTVNPKIYSSKNHGINLVPSFHNSKLVTVTYGMLMNSTFLGSKSRSPALTKIVTFWNISFRRDY
jgi:hypothetical protein